MLVACLVLPFSSYLGSVKAQNLDPNQVYSTGNIVLPSTNSSSWVNGVYQPSLTCWSWGDPGYCGPNAIVRPGGNINFSYGTTDLHQIQAIANVLPNSGTGLIVNGYNFGFTAKNGNGWDDGRVDRLNAYVTFYDSSNNIAFNKNYNLNYQFNWTTFNYSETFQTPLATGNLSNVRYGFVGGDNNFWSGPYGPELYGVNFSLKYTVDPCSVDPLSKPTCPGYMEALAKLTPQTVEIAQQPVTEIKEVQQPATVTSTVAASAPVNNQSTSSAPQTTAGTQQKANESTSSSSSPSLRSILNIIGNEQSRLSRLETSVAGAAVEQAKQEASKVTAEAQSVATSQQAQTVSSAQTLVASMVSQQIQTTSRTNIYSLQLSSQQTDRASLSLQQSNQSARSDVSEAARQAVTEETSESKQLLSVTSPVALLSNSQLPTLISPTAQQESTVKKDVELNDAAGGRDISSIAKQPPGFDAYSTFTLKDIAFYKPEEVYKNQVNVDNARALRQLSSDRLHNEMVEQQYKR